MNAALTVTGVSCIANGVFMVVMDWGRVLGLTSTDPAGWGFGVLSLAVGLVALKVRDRS